LWYEGEKTFASELATLSRKVVITDCGQHKDFNDLYKTEGVTSEQVSELLASHGMSLLESEVSR